jgi:hypothetical protein
MEFIYSRTFGAFVPARGWIANLNLDPNPALTTLLFPRRETDVSNDTVDAINSIYLSIDKDPRS